MYTHAHTHTRNVGYRRMKIGQRVAHVENYCACAPAHSQTSTHARARTHTHTHTGIDRVGIPVVCDDDPDALLRHAGLPLPRQPRRASLLGSRVILHTHTHTHTHTHVSAAADRHAFLLGLGSRLFRVCVCILDAWVSM